MIGLRESLTAGVRSHLWLLLGAAASVLLIASASVGNLLLAQTSGRRLEFATRAALGATRARLVRQLLTESFFLALLGGLTGLLFARWALPALVAAAPPESRGSRRSASTAPRCGSRCWPPARSGWRAARLPARPRLVPRSRRFGRDRRHGLPERATLPSAPHGGRIALALTLVIGTGLLVRTLRAWPASNWASCRPTSSRSG